MCDLCILRVVLNNFIFLRLKFWVLKLDELIKHLFFQPKRSNCKIKQTYFDLSLWTIMRIWQGGRKEEFKIRTVFNPTASELDVRI